jgi:hypothetical protein
VNALRAILRPVPRRAFLILFALNVALRLYLATLPGFLYDIMSIRDWGLGAALWGISEAYEMTPIDYPPLILYVLSPAGHTYVARHRELKTAEVELKKWGEYFFTLEDGTVYRSWDVSRRIKRQHLRAEPLPDADYLSFLVKLTLIVFDLLLGGLLGLIVAKGLWGPDRRGVEWGYLAALFYIWNPAVLMDVSYWGQSDCIHSLLVVGSLALLGRSRMFGSGVLLATAGMMKPLAAPLLPLLVSAAALRGRLKGFVLAGLGGFGAATLILLPFILAGHFTQVLDRLISGVDVMPYTSANGHTLWWILGAWKDPDARLVGPITPRIAGLSLLSISYAVLLYRSRHRISSESSESDDYSARIFLIAASMTASFFYLSTHMHENHLFMAIPMLIAVAGRSRQLLGLMLLCSCVAFLNMILHDGQLPYLLPGFLGRPTHWSQYVTHLQLTPVQLVFCYANALTAGIVFVWTFRSALLPAIDPETFDAAKENRA